MAGSAAATVPGSGGSLLDLVVGICCGDGVSLVFIFVVGIMSKGHGCIPYLCLCPSFAV
uniref:Uncharacterized protein n=1 Tax=Arundo donax TaxID=35708 RepID=A0A0A8YYZ2_ARUDO